MVKKLKDNFYKLLSESGIQKDLIYMNENTPKNKNIIIFIFMLIISFFYFIIVFFIVCIYFIFYCSITLKTKIKKEEKIININCKNNHKNYFLFFYKELFINYSKTKAFFIFYNFLKILNKKKTKI